MSTLIRAKQIDSLHGQLLKVSGLVHTRNPPSAELDVTALFADKKPGSDTRPGVFGDGDRVALEGDNFAPFHVGQLEAYGRLHHDAGTWKLTVCEKGTHEKIVLPANQRYWLRITCVESVQLRDVKPSSVQAHIDAQTNSSSDTQVGSHSPDVAYGTKRQLVKPTPAQTAFTLEHSPVDPLAVECRVNGQDVTSRTSVLGTSVSYDPVDFELDDKDEVTFIYRISITL